MRLELTRVGLLAELANHYTTRGAFKKVTYEVFVYKSYMICPLISYKGCLNL